MEKENGSCALGKTNSADNISQWLNNLMGIMSVKGGQTDGNRAIEIVNPFFLSLHQF